MGYIEVIERDVYTGAMTYFRGPNRVANDGLGVIANRLSGNIAFTGATYYALGGNSTPPTPSDTALLNELYRDRITQTRVVAGELKLTLHLGATQGNGMTFREGGAFTQLPQNFMVCRAVFPDKAKTPLKELTIIHTIPITAS